MAKKITEEELDRLEQVLKGNNNVKSTRFSNAWNKSLVTTNTYTRNALCAKVIEYFQYIEDQRFEFKSAKGIQLKYKTPTFAGLRLYLGVNKKEWTRLSKEFPDVIDWVKDNIEDFLVSAATMDIINPITTIFALKNQFGWKDQNEMVNDKQIIVNVGNKIGMKEADVIQPAQIPNVSVEETINNLKKAGLSFDSSEQGE